MAWTLVQRLFGGKGNKGNKEEAKLRLRFVLTLDRLGLTSEDIEALRKDILETIKRHIRNRNIAIDPEQVKIDFEDQRTPVMVFKAPMDEARPAAEATKQSAG
jgi:cell division topological specificity factor MinE